MLIAVDFDNVIVNVRGRAYTDTTTPLMFMPGAKEGLAALKRAGHKLLLYSARANRALLFTPEWDPLVRAGVKRPHEAVAAQSKALHWARYREMLAFCEAELPGMFDAIDDGLQGKPLADLFIDDRALTFGDGADRVEWPQIAMLYGATSAAPKGAVNE